MVTSECSARIVGRTSILTIPATCCAIIVCALLLTSTGCNNLEQSASMAFDNANEVVHKADDKLWIPADGKPTPAVPTARK